MSSPRDPKVGPGAPGEDPGRRLFFALWPQPAARRPLVHLAASLPAPALPVAAPDLHLTVLFLGQVPEALLPALCAAAARVRTGALAQPLDRLELWGGARLCCAAGDAVSALKDLQQALVIVATDLGISIESREFIAHVTLARSRARLPEAVARRFRPPLRIVARELVLAESGAAIAGRRYRRLGSWPLG